jgi:hypothetical protein
MKERLLSIVRTVLFVLLAVSVIIPRVQAISFCNPMDQVMLTPCCHPETQPELEEGADSVHRPACCDEIAIPSTAHDTATATVIPMIHLVPSMPALPQIEWRANVSIKVERAIQQARGPPPDPLPLFIQHCSYRI